ncbi:hypothetical protein D3C72_2193570 [compost metagenome]
MARLFLDQLEQDEPELAAFEHATALAAGTAAALGASAEESVPHGMAGSVVFAMAEMKVSHDVVPL